MKRKHLIPALLPIAMWMIEQPAMAQQPLASSLGMVVYPSNGQTFDQQTLDENECFAWSKNTTGVDPASPMAGILQHSPAPTPSSGA